MKEKCQRSYYFHLIFCGDERESLSNFVNENGCEIGIVNFLFVLHDHCQLHTHLLIELQYPTNIKDICKFFEEHLFSISFLEPIYDYFKRKDYLMSAFVNLEVGD